MPIRWKVVSKSRKSCIIHSGSEYSITYVKGETVRESKKAVGIMTFEKKCQAKDFNSKFNNQHKGDIIKVFGVGRGRKVKTVCYITLSAFYLNFNADGTPFRPKEAPKGTICYEKVKVLA